MPLSNLKVTTVFGDRVLEGDETLGEIYKRNLQDKRDTKAPVVEPVPKKIEKPKARKPRAKKVAANDEALIKANKTDLTKRNIK